jgi:regulator of protease activity HflC (stomatin/prohibitin superfamily)
MGNRRFLPLIIGLFVVLLVIILLSNRLFVTLKPGERGIIFDRFRSPSLIKEPVYDAGFHTKAPWSEMIVYDVTENNIEETMDVLDKSGLSIKVDASVRFNPVYDKIGSLHEVFRGDYVNRLVIPEVRSTVRKVMGRYTAEEIYSTKRSEVENTIIVETENVLKQNFIVMKALLIRSINLPEQIKQAIENKLQQEQEALAYQFRLSKEKSEAERKRIEAEGSSKANQIINSSLTSELLKMRGIEATLKLAESPNSKVIIIGSGKDGLPLILGNN